MSTSNFKVNGITVDASGAKFERGTAANLANGIFVATEVAVKTGKTGG